MESNGQFLVSTLLGEWSNGTINVDVLPLALSGLAVINDMS